MDTKHRNLLKMLIFALIFSILLVGMGRFFQPVWKDWNHYDTIHGFYEEPNNTIETIFLGASITANGIIPMELYKDYGICSYNLGTQEQPMLASYYWLLEAYRIHKEALKTVVLDVSMLRRSPHMAFYRKSIDAMHFSKIKYNAVKDYTKDFNETISYLIPLFSYHNRWLSLNKTDFQKAGYRPESCVRGYNFVTARYFNSSTYDVLEVSTYIEDANQGLKKGVEKQRKRAENVSM